MSELVTGEAVALELRPARLPSRALAVLIDLIVAVVVYIAVTIALVAASASLDDAAQMALSIAAFLLVLVGGPIAVETLSHGRSLGKLAVGLRVVRDDGGPIRFRHALVRGAIGVVEILMTFGVVACIASLVSARGRRLGDVFAGTLVVRERIPVAPSGFVPPPPPWLAGRFSELDLSAVPDGLWLAVRQYLTRMHQLDPQVGWAMAERLASDLAARTGAPAPRDVPPGAYLAAVVQERQARESRRAFGSGTTQTGAFPAVGHGPAVGPGPAVGAQGGYSYPGVQSAAPSSPQPPVASPFVPPVSYGVEAAAVGERPGRPGVPVDGTSPAESSNGPRPAVSSEDRPASGFVPPA
ncbi:MULTISPECIES: RDD family protein [unclassified Streptomyces]|uniref:RDD family protein n=1 Tax=unclassified Streptomyces TaxID=2593676 RepID=UPI002473774E|nr:MULTISPECIES: RDD family protein [unclassified Streptomyces]MDH6450629.1 putative RDD family membrane protein YckC [Streptomyces sp. SAI-119]MDH6498826.1 putative RDD family membrane protein YckC [Streptomyces sp. SAI-149]